MPRRSIVCSALVLAACGGKSSGGSGSPSWTPSPPSSFGTPTTIEQHILNPPTVMLSDGTDLFWLDQNDVLWRDPVGGGSPTQLATNAFELFYLDATSVYFADQNGFASMPKQGGATTTVVPIAGGWTGATVASGVAYWSEEQQPSATQPGIPKTLLMSAPMTAGGAVTTLGIIPSPAVSGVAVSGSTIFLQFATSAGIFEPDGGAPAPIAVTCLEILAGTDGVYCAGDSINLVAPDGTTTTLIASETNNARSLALDSTNLYWVNEAPSGGVVTAPKNGGANITIAYDVNPTAVAVDDAAVYWGDEAGNLQRAAKP